jgi:hypothetical protein
LPSNFFRGDVYRSCISRHYYECSASRLVGVRIMGAIS